MNTFGRFDAASVARRNASKSLAARLVLKPPSPFSPQAHLQPSVFFDFAVGVLVDVGVLVCAKQNFFAASNVGVTFCAAFVYACLHFTFVALSEETTIVNHVKEEFPSFVCN
jgi:hypothetical protein